MPPDCTHSSGAVHPVLWSPTSTRPHTPRCTYTQSQICTTPTMVPTLTTVHTIGQEVMTSDVLQHMQLGRAVSHLTWALEKKMFFVEFVLFFLIACYPSTCPTVPLPNITSFGARVQPQRRMMGNINK